MKGRKNQTPTNDEINGQADMLTDLPLAAEQAARTTGGFDNQGKLLVGTDNALWR